MAYFKTLRLGLIADNLSACGLANECQLQVLTPFNYWLNFKIRKPEILFVESAWQGHGNAWKYKIAAYPDHPRRNNSVLRRLVMSARDRGIPTVFWNKEDGVHFERFIESAKFFDHVFTVDENSIPRYREHMGANASVHTLMFPVQPIFHYFTGFNFKYRRANFVGSYSRHTHPRRRQWQDMMFNAATDLGVTVFDRNSSRKADCYRYPPLQHVNVKASLPYPETAQIYKDYLVSLNVNTIDDSPSMYSRRLVEILACGGIAVTNPSLAVERLFKDYCHVVSSEDEARELFSRLRHGPSSDDLERARAGAEYVLREHTWAQRLQQIAQVVGL